MDIQFLLSLLLGVCACLYIYKGIVAKFQKSDQNIKCGECNVEEETVQTDK